MRSSISNGVNIWKVKRMIEKKKRMAQTKQMKNDEGESLMRLKTKKNTSKNKISNNIRKTISRNKGFQAEWIKKGEKRNGKKTSSSV